MNDPLKLAIRALNDIPNTRFRNPIGDRFRTTYELVAFLEEVKRHTEMFEEEMETNPKKAQGWGKMYLYFVPVY